MSTFTFSGTKTAPQPPNTTEDSSQNSDMGDTKSLSPPTSVSEMSADTEPRPDIDSEPVKMDVDAESKDSSEQPEERLTDVISDSLVSLITVSHLYLRNRNFQTAQVLEPPQMTDFV